MGFVVMVNVELKIWREVTKDCRKYIIGEFFVILHIISVISLEN